MCVKINCKHFNSIEARIESLPNYIEYIYIYLKVDFLGNLDICCPPLGHTGWHIAVYLVYIDVILLTEYIIILIDLDIYYTFYIHSLSIVKIVTFYCEKIYYLFLLYILYCIFISFDTHVYSCRHYHRYIFHLLAKHVVKT